MLTDLLEYLFTLAAERTQKILGQIFKGCSGFDAVIGIAYFGIVNPTANSAFVLFHNFRFLKFVNNKTFLLHINQKPYHIIYR